MPIYEYVCPECEVKFEKLRPMNDGNVAPCPTCDQDSPRVLSVFAPISASSDGEPVPLGGGCACVAGGACGCSGDLGM